MSCGFNGPLMRGVSCPFLQSERVGIQKPHSSNILAPFVQHRIERRRRCIVRRLIGCEVAQSDETSRTSSYDEDAWRGAVVRCSWLLRGAWYGLERTPDTAIDFDCHVEVFTERRRKNRMVRITKRSLVSVSPSVLCGSRVSCPVLSSVVCCSAILCCTLQMA